MRAEFALLLRAHGPRLHQPPTREQLIQVLSAYAALDPVPRVQQRTSALIAHAEDLTQNH